MPHIIDFHTHIFPEAVARKAVAQVGNHYHLKMRGTGTVDDLLESAVRSNIDYVVFHSTATKASQVRNINEWVASKAGGKLIGFGTLHPDMDDVEEEFERILALGLKGIKLHPDFQGFDADDPRMDRIYTAISDRVPLLIHAGDENLDSSSPQRLAHVIDKFPKLIMVAAHLGGHKQWEEALDYLVGRNLYLDTSSALQFMDIEKANKIIRLHGTNKVVFGTDYPITYHDRELEDFYRLDLNDREREDILFNNAARLLNINSAL